MASARPVGGLPYGAVMATGAVSQLAVAAGLPWLRVPALLLAVVTAVAVAVVGVWGVRRWWADGAGLGFGHFTVPVGLAVIALGTVSAAPSWTWVYVTAVLLAWASTLLLVAVVVVPVFAGVALRAVNGVWFIAPAAFLADGAATAAWAERSRGVSADVLTVVAVAAVWVGVGVYAVLLVLGGMRFAHYRLRDAPRAAWWIVVGCGGLAAASLGAAAGVSGVPGRTALDGTAVVCWLVASVLLVPTAALSIRHLAGTRALAPRPAWPPAFSTGVYALGTAHMAALAPAAGWLPVLVTVVAIETTVVWAVTGSLRVRTTLLALRRAAVREPR